MDAWTHRLGGDGGGLVFPSKRGKLVSATTLPKMLQQHGVAAVPRGFRSSFRDWGGDGPIRAR